MIPLKGHYAVVREEIQMHNFNMYNINEVIIQTQKYLSLSNWINELFSDENKVPENSWKLERWQGPPHKQSNTI